MNTIHRTSNVLIVPLVVAALAVSACAPEGDVEQGETTTEVAPETPPVDTEIDAAHGDSAIAHPCEEKRGGHETDEDGFVSEAVESAEEAGKVTAEGAEEVGEATAEGVEEAGEATLEGIEKTGEGVEEAGEAIEEGVSDDEEAQPER